MDGIKGHLSAGRNLVAGSLGVRRGDHPKFEQRCWVCVGPLCVCMWVRYYLNSAIDAITRLTNYTVLHKMRIVKRFNFHHTKAI